MTHPIEGLAQDEIIGTLISPNGIRTDISDRMDLGSIGDLTETLEDELLVLTHADFDLEIRDADGELFDLLQDASRADEWRFELERRTGARRGQWELIFAGVLDVPLSIEYDHKDEVLSVQVFSYSKLLEKVDLESEARVDTGYRATVSAGTVIVTLDADHDFPGGALSYARVGDLIELNDGATSEAHPIERIVSTSVVWTAENWDNTFTDVPLTLITKWPWHLTLEQIARKAFAAAGIDEILVRVGIITSTLPFPSGWTERNGFASNILSLTSWTGTATRPNWHANRGDHILVRNEDGSDYISTDPDDEPWSLEFTGSAADQDWSDKYEAPVASPVQTHADFQNGRGMDIQGNYGKVEPDDQYWAGSPDHTNGDSWRLLNDHDPTGADPILYLRENGTTRAVVDNPSGNTSTFFESAFIQFVPFAEWPGFSNNGIITSHENHLGNRYFKLYVAPVGGGGAVTEHVVSTNDRGGGGIGVLGRHRCIAIQDSTGEGNQPDQPGDITFWEGNTVASPFMNRVTFEDGSERILSDQPVMLMYTFRVLGPWIACLYQSPAKNVAVSQIGTKSRETRIRIWRWDTLAQVADFRIHEWSRDDTYLIRMDYGGQEVLVASVGHQQYIIAQSWLGTVPYCDFADKSAAKILNDIAVLAQAYVSIDQHRIGTIAARTDVTGGERELPENLISEIEQPLTDDYASSVQVSGKDKGGEDFEVTIGADSANRVEIESDLITTTALAEGVAQGYAELLAGTRIELNVEVSLDEIDDLYHANEIVLRDGRLYRVIEATTDLDKRQQALRMIEVGEQTFPPLGSST